MTKFQEWIEAMPEFEGEILMIAHEKDVRGRFALIGAHHDLLAAIIMLMSKSKGLKALVKEAAEMFDIIAPTAQLEALFEEMAKDDPAARIKKILEGLH